MPKVGNKEFSYTPKGIAQANAAKKKTEMNMGGKVMGYKSGGKVKIRGTGAATQGIFARGPMG